MTQSAVKVVLPIHCVVSHTMPERVVQHSWADILHCMSCWVFLSNKLVTSRPVPSRAVLIVRKHILLILPRWVHLSRPK